MNENKYPAKTQGAETEKQERMPSPTQTIKTLGATIKRIEKLKLLKKEDVEEMKKLHEKAVKQYMGMELGV